ncbi:MAG: hypothetical protein IT284_01050 [Bacteroidetes bacterium]|nr:hypothetical protein [Bacteroidota bacterium]
MRAQNFQPDLELSQRAFCNAFMRGDIFLFSRLTEENKSKYEPIINSTNDQPLILTFKDERDRLGMTNEKIDHSYVELGVARWLVMHNRFHHHDMIAIRFCSNENTRVELYRRLH